MWTRRTECQWSHLYNNPNRKHTGSPTIEKPSLINIFQLQRTTLDHFWEGRQCYLKDKWCFHSFPLRLCTCYDFQVCNTQHVQLAPGSTTSRISSGRRCTLSANHPVESPLCALTSTFPTSNEIAISKNIFCIQCDRAWSWGHSDSAAQNWP